jgi:hypothetical protein
MCATPPSDSTARHPASGIHQVSTVRRRPFGDFPRQVPFRNGGGCPIATVIADGTTAETAAVSDEGMLGGGSPLLQGHLAPTDEPTDD